VGQLLRTPGAPRARLRQLLAGPGPLLAPGSYDALSARLVEQAGFDVVYMTGFGSTASLIGRPDVGLLTGTEMIDNARRIVAAVDVPVIADADTGYGNAINVVRTVQAYEQAGVAGIHLEDQVMPKKCGHMSGKAVIGPEEMAGKICASGRRPARPGLPAHRAHRRRRRRGAGRRHRRARRFADAGADVLFVEAPTSEADIEQVTAQLRDLAPLVFNWTEGGRTPGLSLARIPELGFSLVLFPLGTMLAATAGMRSLLATLRADGTPAAALAGVPSFDEFTELVGLPELRELERRFGSV
jgi:2,3-dimethylmalate lyase